jgi:hypothetical protein
MIARYLLVGLLALGIPTAPPAQQGAPSQTLLAPAPLSDQIKALTVTEYSGKCAGIKPQPGTGDGPPCIHVELHGLAVHDNGVWRTVTDGASSPNLLSARTTQVWLLRKDGTAVGNLFQPMAAMWSDDYPVPFGMLFTFQAVPPQDLAGVVVSVNGKLYVREFKAS